MILLDTKVVSELMKPQPDAPVLGWVDRQCRHDLFTTAITGSAIELGLALFAKDFAGVILPFDANAAAHYATRVAHRTRIGRLIPVAEALEQAALMAGTLKAVESVNLEGVTLPPGVESPQALESHGNTQCCVLQSRDTLSKIARQYYGDGNRHPPDLRSQSGSDPGCPPDCSRPEDSHPAPTLSRSLNRDLL